MVLKRQIDQCRSMKQNRVSRNRLTHGQFIFDKCGIQKRKYDLFNKWY